MFTEEQINEILAVCGKATPGPWYGLQDAGVFTNPEHEKPIFETGCGCCTSADLKTEDADFIALARTALPQLAEDYRKLLAVAEAAEKAVANATDTLRNVNGNFAIECWNINPEDMDNLIITLTDAGYGGEE